MTTDTLERHLAKLGAPIDLCDWARGYADLPAAWAACERGDWLAWLAVRLAETDAERRAAARAAAACARLALPYLRVPDGRLTAAVEAAEDWAARRFSGDATRRAAEGATAAAIAHMHDRQMWAVASAAWAAAWTAVWLDRAGAPESPAQAARHAVEAAALAAGPEAAPALLARSAALVREHAACPRLPLDVDPRQAAS